MTKKFVFTEKFISYADVEIYAENEDEALAKYHRGDFSMSNYSISDYKDDFNLLDIREETQEVA